MNVEVDCTLNFLYVVVVAECKNTWDDQQCEGWARDQECLKNQIWMTNNCNKACTKCSGDDDGTTDHVTTRTTPKPTQITDSYNTDGMYTQVHVYKYP